MKSSIALDASALLAYLLREPGADTVEAYLNDAVMSAVNYAEVATCLQRLGMGISEIKTLLTDVGLVVIPFDETQAMEAAALYAKTLCKGLSFGDRACLALAKTKHLSVLTGDRAWYSLALGVKIIPLRP